MHFDKRPHQQNSCQRVQFAAEPSQCQRDSPRACHRNRRRSLHQTPLMNRSFGSTGRRSSRRSSRKMGICRSRESRRDSSAPNPLDRLRPWVAVRGTLLVGERVVPCVSLPDTAMIYDHQKDRKRSQISTQAPELNVIV